MGEEIRLDKKSGVAGAAVAELDQPIDLAKGAASLKDRAAVQSQVRPTFGMVGMALEGTAPAACPPDCGVEYAKRPAWNLAVGPLVQDGNFSISGAPVIESDLTGEPYPVPGTLETHLSGEATSSNTAIKGIGLTVTHSIANGPGFVGGGLEYGRGNANIIYDTLGTQNELAKNCYGDVVPVEVNLNTHTTGTAKVETAEIFATGGGAWNFGTANRWFASISGRLGFGKTSVDANGTSVATSSGLTEPQVLPALDVSASKTGITYGADAGLGVRITRNFGLEGKLGYGAGPGVSAEQNGIKVAAEPKGLRAALNAVFRW